MAEHIYEKNDRHMSDIEIIKNTWPYVKPYTGKLVGVLLLMILMIFVDLAASVLPGYITSSLGELARKLGQTPEMMILP